MLSILFLRARCRTCKAPISWRYFWVELITALLFLLFYLHFRSIPIALFYGLFAAPLVAGAFIDLERFEIPDELNSFALFVGLAFDGWGIAARLPGHELLWGWLPRSILGAMICAAVFVFIQLLGAAMFKKDAMGDGDVKLARAIGAMLPLSIALVSFLLAIAVGAVIGVLMLVLSGRNDVPESAPSTDAEENPVSTDDANVEAEEEQQGAAPVGETLYFGAIYVFFIDEILRILASLRISFARRELGLDSLDTDANEGSEEPFVAGPTHIPFGPYMVLGAFLAIFIGSRIIDWYLRWSNLAGP